MPAIVLFDGDCNFCDASVQFIIHHDRHASIHFASLQSEVGQSLRTRHRIPESVDSIVYIEEGVPYLKSDAAIRIAEHLDGRWRLLRLIRFIPRPIRDHGYALFAKHRTRLFGKKEVCTLPSPDVRKRFLDR
ncbi:thiol-disulfide oxidoreductase DCC family protein [Exiguobacterium sp. MER 193]|uniref:thiol-disulfide oxidoreductase DCC family protein n=1 Tax=Exiguobacterium sp. MER 193 TaxID=2939564 RepID=UPI0020425839|nr:thiol-disulfide oxidoreductase DCC family protein [Exiguobacterium sp. MER 193]MCM3280666.1 thiol-disulfide oxidoreductase DCC family protein [Exiguobacterium sp. MER 193]